jgi:protein-tyrosine phosphatase
MNLFKRLALSATVIVMILASALVFAKITDTLLILDMPNVATLPDNFRTTSDELAGMSSLQKQGLDKLHAAGSQQFSEQGLKTALSRLPTHSVIVVDLRRESHGLLNGSGISWYGPQNSANEAKSPSQIKVSETRLLTRLKKSHFKWVYKILEKTKDNFIEKTKIEFVVVDNVKSEQQLVLESHLGYQRFYVEDFHAPRELDVTHFVTFARTVPENTWLYFHCKAGKGRTTTFMVMYDMMKNAKNIAFDDILARQKALGGTDLREMPDKKNFKYKFAQNRLNFLKKFYDYAKQNNDNFSTTWEQWLINQ